MNNEGVVCVCVCVCVCVYTYTHIIHTYIQNGMLLSHKKEWNNTIYSYKYGLRDYHAKWSKPNRERQISYDITYIWSLKNGISELFHKTDIDSQT